ncbi:MULTISPECIES: phosphoenolpyruvate synthase [Dehalococcoides]|jgi:pyruvate,water dikinase|uniref:Phosphoenolpyruvate synthase n=2 Tax=Dehalococcoides mccartyi TaxID=61435 RepID=A0A142V914_9CHLR|nr:MULTISPECIES: phosphoenolpyruvate synthase [Dehalococcoides]AGG06190.1 phosphoenolpyruvate synthase [Dehalococcoides mccartyi DCMB5]AGG07622.1 phosphoenolpyruvate synthase [Dehalococcoides mccartyi BTF08]AII60654.1 phosphoenolpyruvate synthase [Dehalococcoides mccartyi CG5]AMU86320.1 phosphoenolpyruvate synthase/pyruvate phosphate dikinase [Dehalococcoides mccartyi]AOV99154.1 phosphoenolpyruvate synthase [Dehalococcoides mccartyi]
MQKGHEAIVWFNEVTKNDIPLVGGKGANLGEMTNAGIPVPPGYIVTANAYFDFINSSNLHPAISKALESLDINDSKQLSVVANIVKEMILSTPMPPGLATQIKTAYKKMGQGLVAVRSSATAEDLPEASFAGQQSTYLNIEGGDEVVVAVQKCWASLFEARAIYYRVQQNFDHLQVGIAVPVQKMVQSQASGVCFTIEPITSDPTKIVIEAIYGLGEGLVSGEITPDLYILDKEGPAVLSRTISHQERRLVRKNGNSTSGAEDESGNNYWQPVPSTKQEQQKITEDDIITLAKLAMLIENHYKGPQDIEWAKEENEIYIVQSRPVTALKDASELEPEIDAPIMLQGAAASPGLATGGVKILQDPSEIDLVLPGDILVAEMTTPDFVPAMKRAAAIVTNRGGRTSHAAIVSRELGIPCVVGTGEATKVLKNDQMITVDGTHGKVYNGKVTRNVKTSNIASIVREAIRTKTRVYVNLAQPELADKVAARNVDGVGLLRAEFIFSQIGKHPRYMIEMGQQEEYIQQVYAGVLSFAKAFYPRPVVYRTNDFKTNEYRDLLGGDKYEGQEENPMLGYRGVSRYIKDIEVFKMEIEAIKRVRKDYPNVYVMLPFVRTVDELVKVKRILEDEGLKRGPDFKLWMMVEVPSNIFLIDKFIDAGIDGISIGSNDLTQLILGVDRDSEMLRETFDERNEAVLVALEKAVTTAARRGITASICGQAPSVYPELTEKLVSWGITSVSVSPDMIGTTREIIAKAEAKLKIK